MLASNLSVFQQLKLKTGAENIRIVCIHFILQNYPDLESEYPWTSETMRWAVEQANYFTVLGELGFKSSWTFRTIIWTSYKVLVESKLPEGYPREKSLLQVPNPHKPIGKLGAK